MSLLGFFAAGTGPEPYTSIIPRLLQYILGMRLAIYKLYLHHVVFRSDYKSGNQTDLLLFIQDKAASVRDKG